MALDYSLDIVADSPPQDVAERVRQIVGAPAGAVSRPSEGCCQVDAPAVLVSVHRPAWGGPSPVAEAFGFTPTLHVGFRLDKERADDGRVSVIETTLALLNELPGDAVLSFNGENPLLLRVAGRLTLNAGHDLWEPSRGLLGRVDVPYEMRPIADL